MLRRYPDTLKVLEKCFNQTPQEWGQALRNWLDQYNGMPKPPL